MNKIITISALLIALSVAQSAAQLLRVNQLDDEDLEQCLKSYADDVLNLDFIDDLERLVANVREDESKSESLADIVRRNGISQYWLEDVASDAERFLYTLDEITPQDCTLDDNFRYLIANPNETDLSKAHKAKLQQALDLKQLCQYIRNPSDYDDDFYPDGDEELI